MADKVFGLDFTDDTAPTGTNTISVNQGAALKDVALSNLHKALTQATDVQAGTVELATDAEAITGTDTARAVTPANLSARTALTTRTGLVQLATNAETITGTDTSKAITPDDLSARSSTTARTGIAELATNAETLTGTDTVRIVTPDDLAYVHPLSGWHPDTNTWTYSSADSPTFIISINADMTAILGVGDRIKLTQTTAKYFIVTAVGAFAAGATLVTVYGGTDYTLANAAISNPFFSHEKAPFGFPVDPIKWTVQSVTTNSPAKSSPTSNTWYGDTGLSPTGPSLVIPIGAWKVSYRVTVDYASNLAAVSNLGCRVTLSTANNSESDPEFTTAYTTTVPVSATALQRATYQAEKQLLLASKTTYYLDLVTGNATGTSPSLTMLGGGAGGVDNIIKAICAYL